MTKSWFEVDKAGLQQLLAKRDKTWVVCELLQNAWDENVTKVRVELTGLPNKALCRLAVTDDSPDGFRNLSHAWTLFAESYKKDDPTKRGRFNVGEKLLLSMCIAARIESTTGAVSFDDSGRHQHRYKTDSGTRFYATIRMTGKEMQSCINGLARVIPPAGVDVQINGVSMKPRAPLGWCDMVLPTVRADKDGNLRPTNRKTLVSFHSPVEQPYLFEMGIPICPLDDGEPYDIDVQQKVPLPLDRDRVSQSYLHKVRVALFNTMWGTLEKADFDRPWARGAAADKNAHGEAFTKSITARFGDKVVSSDPSDPEGTKLAVSEEYTVVHGGSLSKGEWENVRKHEVIKPAGQVTPSPKAYGNGDIPVEVVNKPGVHQQYIMDYSRRLLFRLLDPSQNVSVRCVRTTNNFSAAWCTDGPRLDFNLNYLDTEFFELARSSYFAAREPLHALLIHEAAHQVSGDHLSVEYHDELCRLGARLATLAANGAIPNGS